ncbi:hypothetical protein [Campylobacter californiensis]|nr:hypothetical protein [Campylobacter sp. RM6914]QCD51214.1 hypothetical protein CCAL_1329 [Campylobacter sp. RM6914]
MSEAQILRYKLYKTRQKVRKIAFIILLCLVIVLIGGCASSKPQIITQTKFQDVYVPIKCEAKLPAKPAYNQNNLQSAKELARYYAQVEALLRGCVGDE